MEYNGGKLKMIPYEESNQEFLKKILATSSQGFLVSGALVKALEENRSVIDDYHKVWMVECECSPGTKIGTIILQEISEEHKIAELLITFDDGEICNDPKVFKGVLDILIDHAFMELGLLRLQVEVLENNLKLIKAYKKAGFIEEGLLRSKYEVKQKRYDTYVMSILKIEWARSRKAA